MKQYTQTFLLQLTICILLFLFCLFLRLTPDTAFAKSKAGIRAILTVQTDLTAYGRNLLSFFQPSSDAEAFSPVTNMTSPSGGTVIKHFGVQDASENGFHYGVVVSCEKGETILAANDGIVSEIATNQEYGSFILIRHSDEISTLYGKLDEILPEVGAHVSAGQPIALPEDGASFYFELRRGNTYLNPAEYISFREANHD